MDLAFSALIWPDGLAEVALQQAFQGAAMAGLYTSLRPF